MEESGPWRKRSLNHTSMNPFESCDHFSVLPDHLLLHILSFLPATDVIKSSFLSRRWKSLWMHVPTIDFKWFSPHNLVKVVDRFLVYYKPMKIQDFLVTLSYEDAYIPLILILGSVSQWGEMLKNLFFNFWILVQISYTSCLQLFFPLCVIKEIEFELLWSQPSVLCVFYLTQNPPPLGDWVNRQHVRKTYFWLSAPWRFWSYQTAMRIVIWTYMLQIHTSRGWW